MKNGGVFVPAVCFIQFGAFFKLFRKPFYCSGIAYGIGGGYKQLTAGDDDS
jgi:hypothetical protein